MGEERAHARFSLVAGGARARGVAFRTSQRSLAACGAQPHDVAVSLERNCWNGRVEPRVVMRSLSPTRPGTLLDVGARPFWDELESELALDAALWWPAPSHARGQTRTVRDRRGEGFAGLAGDLLTSGEPVLVVVADVDRRRGSLEALVAGMAPGGLGAVSWAALGANPGVAAAYSHLLALDPPPAQEGVALLAEAPGRGLAHLAWGEPECAFTAAHWRAQLAVRPGLTELWRALDGRSLEGDALESGLRGSGAYPRSGALGGRLLRVLSSSPWSRSTWPSACAALCPGRKRTWSARPHTAPTAPGWRRRSGFWPVPPQPARRSGRLRRAEFASTLRGWPRCLDRDVAARQTEPRKSLSPPVGGGGARPPPPPPSPSRTSPTSRSTAS